MNGIIYMRTSPSGRSYIGQTCFEEVKRWKQHVYNAYYEKSADWNTPLSCSIRKYGGDSFTVKILESGIKTREELNTREVYWIKYYHTLIYEGKGGLNATLGGVGYRKFTDEQFQELYDQGYSIGTIAKITGASVAAVSARLKTNRTENCRRARMLTLQKKPPKSVSSYDITTLEKVASFPSAADAALYFTGRREAALISNAINGVSNSAYGFIWKYDDQPMSVVYEKHERIQNPKRRTLGRPVVNIETGEVFKSALAASKHYNVKSNLITSCCDGMRENVAGYHWRYEGEEAKPYTGKHAKPIMCIETGVIYPSASEAVRQTGIHAGMLTDCLKKRRETAGGLHWKYTIEENIDGGIFVNTRFKPVVCVETGQVYPSINEAAAQLHVGLHKMRSRLKDPSKTIDGFHFTWK